MTLAKLVETCVKAHSLTNFYGNIYMCSDKFNFISNVKPSCFRNKLLFNKILLNKRVA